MAILGILGVLCCIAAFVCGIIILIDAFKNEIWKGILALFCSLYLLYYGLVEYQAENKWLIVAIWLGGAIVGAGLMVAGGMAAIPHTGVPGAP
ncbi:MAG: hypothetical protein JWL77_5990 [Chthonomonadaceae bacterium]|nr:hypothetical protein [Chthonomonadaceae bacterium]